MLEHTKKELGIGEYDAKLFGILLLPSWLSGVLITFVSVLGAAGIIVASRWQGSQLNVDYQNYKASQSGHVQQIANSNLFSNSFIANLPLLLFWMLIGLFVYRTAISVYGIFASTSEIRDELSYVHADRHALIREAVEHLVVRLVVLAVWIPYLLAFLHYILPFCVASSLAASAQLTSVQGAGYAVMAAVTMMVALHAHVILLRLLYLKARLFSHSLSVN